jgi:hypothetical protein
MQNLIKRTLILMAASFTIAAWICMFRNEMTIAAIFISTSANMFGLFLICLNKKQ